MEVTTKKHSSRYKSTSAGCSESNFLQHKRRRSSAAGGNKSDVSKLPPAIQVWPEEDHSTSSSCKTETNTTSSEDDELDEELALTPKVIPCSAGGSMFLMPEVSKKTHKKLRDIDQTPAAAAAAVVGSHLQVPFAVPRRRHSWICG